MVSSTLPCCWNCAQADQILLYQPEPQTGNDSKGPPLSIKAVTCCWSNVALSTPLLNVPTSPPFAWLRPSGTRFWVVVMGCIQTSRRLGHAEAASNVSAELGICMLPRLEALCRSGTIQITSAAHSLPEASRGGSEHHAVRAYKKPHV